MEMDTTHTKQIAAELKISTVQVLAAAELLDDGGTVPFISRYRKEVTGNLDEVQITAIRDRIAALRELDKRRAAIIKSLKERELYTEELAGKVMAAANISELEDIYLPYKPKKRTRATMARERGLEPLAKIIFKQLPETDPQSEAAAYIDKEKDVETADDALAGARDIIAEWISEDKATRQMLRTYYAQNSIIRSKVIKDKQAEGAKYRDYFQWEEPAKDAPSHRVLAIRRAEREGFLTMRTTPPEEGALQIIKTQFIRGNSASSEQVLMAIADGYKRLLSLSMEAELRLNLKKLADEEAIRVFRENLRQLLLAPPLGQKSILAIDPGFRSGCKVVSLNSQGKFLQYETIFPHSSQGMVQKAREIILAMCAKHNIEAIAIGNGTASRETETFVRAIGLPKDIAIVMVNESGASIYSASAVAREEFPDQDVTVRGSVSIGRRLMDPLAELVKIDPKSIGVGQYQHDVDQTALKRSLDDVTISCVNAVGVEVNTASAQLLTYVSGLGPVLAKSIIEHRQQNGPFKSRTALKKVPRLGPKAFEQAAGFLRIGDAQKNPLDRSAVHPESYHIVKQMTQDIGCTIAALMDEPELTQKIELSRYVSDTVGMPTLTDIISELSKPGRDPREQFESMSFAEGVNEMKDLEAGMRLPGIVTNITNFGAFVDIGVHQDGLVHISHLADRFVKDPNQIVKVGQKVDALVLEIDMPRKRIALSLKKPVTDRSGQAQKDKQPAKADKKKKPEQPISKKESLKRLKSS
jgi:uncharacterized protein